MCMSKIEEETFLQTLTYIQIFKVSWNKIFQDQLRTISKYQEIPQWVELKNIMVHG
jgi:hypothetical protein